MSDTPSLSMPGKESRSRHVAKRICFVPCASAFTMRKNGAGFHATSILEEYSQHHGVSKPSLGHPLGLSLMMSGPLSVPNSRRPLQYPVLHVVDILTTRHFQQRFLYCSIAMLLLQRADATSKSSGSCVLLSFYDRMSVTYPFPCEIFFAWRKSFQRATYAVSSLIANLAR